MHASSRCWMLAPGRTRRSHSRNRLMAAPAAVFAAIWLRYFRDRSGSAVADGGSARWTGSWLGDRHFEVGSRPAAAIGAMTCVSIAANERMSALACRRGGIASARSAEIDMASGFPARIWRALCALTCADGAPSSEVYGREERAARAVRRHADSARGHVWLAACISAADVDTGIAQFSSGRGWMTGMTWRPIR